MAQEVSQKQSRRQGFAEEAQEEGLRRWDEAKEGLGGTTESPSERRGHPGGLFLGQPVASLGAGTQPLQGRWFCPQVVLQGRSPCELIAVDIRQRR